MIGAQSSQVAYLPAGTPVIDQPRRPQILGLGIRVVRLGEDDHALPHDSVLLQELAENDLGLAIRVRVGSVECLDSGE